MATIAKNIPKMAESVSEKYVPSNTLSVVKGKVDSHANTIKKDMEILSKDLKKVSALTVKLVSKGGLAGSYNGKSLANQVSRMATRLDDRADRCHERSGKLINGIDKSTRDMQKTLLMICQSWDECQAKFKKYGL
ncbi:hypothetical protein IKE96_00305 [bacterium]|nr:hypothetical protein [bacterium]